NGNTLFFHRMGGMLKFATVARYTETTGKAALGFSAVNVCCIVEILPSRLLDLPIWVRQK
ncbi:hypothetical protein, partial [Pseudophaeobacter leonis]|uniref:hypothetical protein n=1 Tax=Pseudophaeobacter leonis TaxID=1144477 RepID=UPI0019D3D1DB